LNNVPKENQVSSPREMIMGEEILDCKSVCRLPFGSYVQVHEDNQVTNTMETRTTGGINLGPSNMTGGHNFFSPVTGEIIMRRKWTELPIPGDVIQKVEEFSNDPNDQVGMIFDEDEGKETKSNEIPEMVEMEIKEEPGHEETPEDRDQEEESNISPVVGNEDHGEREDNYGDRMCVEDQLDQVEV
jgi:hypothetical protein